MTIKSVVRLHQVTEIHQCKYTLRVYTSVLHLFIRTAYVVYIKLAEDPGVARGKNFEKKNFDFFSLSHPRPPMSVHKKFQPNQSSRLAGYTQHIYTNVVFYYIDRFMLCYLFIYLSS